MSNIQEQIENLEYKGRKDIQVLLEAIRDYQNTLRYRFNAPDPHYAKTKDIFKKFGVEPVQPHPSFRSPYT
jgi:hypothetical protein